MSIFYVLQIDPPVYIPKTTYKYENDHQRELPTRPETLPDPTMMSYTKSSAYADQSNYLEYDPMDFVVTKNRRTEVEEYPEFPELPPFGKEEFGDREEDFNNFKSPRSYAISDRRSSGRSLHFAPEFGPTAG